MAVKILIKRIVPKEDVKDPVPLFREMRILALTQPGYISGETMRKLHSPEQFLVISTWESSDDWERWLQRKERKAIQDRIDSILGGKTQYEIYHYGFAE